MCGVSTYVRVKAPGGYRDIGYYFPFRHDPDPVFGNDRPRNNLPEEFISSFRGVIESNDKILVGHNLPFDFRSLAGQGWKLPVGIWHDTMFQAHMINEEFQSFQLEWLNSVLFDDKGAGQATSKLHKLANAFGGMHKLPPEMVGQYSIGDVRRTDRLFTQWIRPRMEKEDLWKLWWPDEAQFVIELSKITQRGILVDPERIKELSDESQAQMRLIKDSLGWDPGKPSVLSEKLFAAPPQGEGLQPLPRPSTRNQKPPFKTPDGRKIVKVPVMGRLELENLRNQSPTIDTVLRYRTYQKADSTWFSGWLDLIAKDGRIHPSFKRHGTVTSRLSSSQPNVQQLPRRSDSQEEEEKYIKHRVKTTLDAPSNTILYEFDYSQIEYRLAACYGEDRHVTDALNSGSDFHTITANQLSITRYDAKTVNFAILYGAGAKKLAAMLRISEEEAVEIIQGIRAGYPGLYRAILSATWAATNHGEVSLWTGRKRHLRVDDAHKAFNSVCQGGAAEIVRYTILRLAKEKPECPIVAQVHDSVWTEVPLKDEERHVQEIKEIMEWPGSHFPIIFPVEEKVLSRSS